MLFFSNQPFALIDFPALRHQRINFFSALPFVKFLNLKKGPQAPYFFFFNQDLKTLFLYKTLIDFVPMNQFGFLHLILLYHVNNFAAADCHRLKDRSLTHVSFCRRLLTTSWLAMFRQFVRVFV